MAGTYGGTAVRLYLDGHVVTSPSGIVSQVAHSGTLVQADYPITIGSNTGFPSPVSEVWSGLIDELEIFNRALDASEIQAIYNAGSAGKCKQPPKALCQNVTVNAGPISTASASIDKGSYEPNGDPVTLPLTQAPAGPYPLGNTLVTLTVTDSNNPSSQSQCTGTVIVQDKTPPAITMASVNPSVLWPSNHKMVDVTVNYTATDNCGQPACKISGVISNEPIGSSDYSIVDAHHVKLSTDRLGSGNGRIYTIPITCTDGAGLTASQSVTVRVPHDQGNR